MPEALGGAPAVLSTPRALARVPATLGGGRCLRGSQPPTGAAPSVRAATLLAAVVLFRVMDFPLLPSHGSPHRPRRADPDLRQGIRVLLPPAPSAASPAKTPKRRSWGKGIRPEAAFWSMTDRRSAGSRVAALGCPTLDRWVQPCAATSSRLWVRARRAGSRCCAASPRAVTTNPGRSLRWLEPLAERAWRASSANAVPRRGG